MRLKVHLEFFPIISGKLYLITTEREILQTDLFIIMPKPPVLNSTLSISLSTTICTHGMAFSPLFGPTTRFMLTFSCLNIWVVFLLLFGWRSSMVKILVIFGNTTFFTIQSWNFGQASPIRLWRAAGNSCDVWRF